MTAAFIRFFSEWIGLTRWLQQPERVDTEGHTLACTIMLLDKKNATVKIVKDALGSDLIERAFHQVDILFDERGYFGLQYTDSDSVNHWLDPAKQVRKQVSSPPFNFHFGVKFYSPEPNNLEDELTRYQFFLQLKQDIYTGRLPCPYETLIELCALALQSDHGDYEADMDIPGKVSECQLVPEPTKQMELDIFDKYKDYVGQTPTSVELNFLQKAKCLELYGADMHKVTGRDSNEYSLGLTPTGILVFEDEQKIGLFFWSKMIKLDSKGKKLMLVAVEDDDSGQRQDHLFEFFCTSGEACKHLWKRAMEHYDFFCPEGHLRGQSQKQNFFRFW